jgi:hypothetical protein
MKPMCGVSTGLEIDGFLKMPFMNISPAQKGTKAAAHVIRDVPGWFRRDPSLLADRVECKGLRFL